MADHVNPADGVIGGVSAICPALLEAHRQLAPPVQPVIKKGDVVLRNLSLWHADMPNTSGSARVMLAFGMLPWWYRSPVRLTLPLKAKEMVESWKVRHGLDFAADFVDEEWPDPKFFATINSTNPALVY